MNILNKTERQKVLEKLEKFGIKKLPYLLTQTGKEKIRAYSGNLTPNDIKILHNLIYIETIGLYIAKWEGEEIRLSLDGSHILKEQITNNITELNKEQTQSWTKGEDLDIKDIDIKDKQCYILVKSKEDFLGCGKISKDKLINFIPKERRIR